jgi:hypothetical protein
MTRQADEAWHGDVDLDGVALEADEGKCICATVVAKWKGFNYSRGYGIPIALFLLGWIKLIPYVMHITMQLGQSSFST